MASFFVVTTSTCLEFRNRAYRLRRYFFHMVLPEYISRIQYNMPHRVTDRSTGILLTYRKQRLKDTFTKTACFTTETNSLYNPLLTIPSYASVKNAILICSSPTTKAISRTIPGETALSRIIHTYTPVQTSANVT